MYTREAEFYDAVMGRDSEREADYIREVVEQHRTRTGGALLDVACGTGKLANALQLYYRVEGIDLSADMLKIAHQNYPDIPFHQGDMADFDLGKQFDVITCMGSAIGYTMTVERLNQAIANMAAHLHYSGVLVVEPWILPEAFIHGYIGSRFINQREQKIAMMSVAELNEGITSFDMHYLVATPQGVEHFAEHHELGLFRDEDYRNAFAAAGLEADPERDRGVSERGLYIARKPEPEEV